ncbi:MAG: HAD-IIA family hydrolase [Oscillospiraceae bacterium]|jgi:NagD protein|nr:HAD-IIA family hydrolase [Oscillospiraceae bacterium]
MGQLDEIRAKAGFLCDMDGVVYHGTRLLEGARAFVDWLETAGKRYLFLTNSSERTPAQLREKLLGMGLDVSEDHFYTSGQATARFIASQSPGCVCYVIGGDGLRLSLQEEGLRVLGLPDEEGAQMPPSPDFVPDYVIVGETPYYGYYQVRQALQYVVAGAKLIGTNPDLTGRDETGLIPTCQALIAPIALASGKTPYYVGKPNALMMRTGLRLLGVHSADATIIGDRMDTDIIAGIETGIDTVLALSGVTTRENMTDFPYRPLHIIARLGDLVP